MEGKYLSSAHKDSIVRTAIAPAGRPTSHSSGQFRRYHTAIGNNTVPKGNVFAMSISAGLLGIKTPHLLLD